MRFPTAWASVAMQNVTLKIATLVLTIVVVVQLIVISALSMRDLPVIERGCFSSKTAAVPRTPTDDEVNAFLAESIPMRFDTMAYQKDGFLSIDELSKREQEQSVLASRQLSQRVLISDIKHDRGNLTVVADRIFSVGKIKSVLPMILKLGLAKTNRTEANPYGLVLESTEEIKPKEPAK